MPRRGMGVEIFGSRVGTILGPVMPRRGMGVEMFYGAGTIYQTCMSCPAGAWE